MTKPHAYKIIKSGVWQIFCPTCWGKMFPRKADADLLGSNGDQVRCAGCGKWVG